MKIELLDLYYSMEYRSAQSQIILRWNIAEEIVRIQFISDIYKMTHLKYEYVEDFR